MNPTLQEPHAVKNNQETYKKIGMIYDRSRAMAVREKIAFAATGLAKSKRPGRIPMRVVTQTAQMGVPV